MNAIFPVLQFLKTLSRFKKRKENSSIYVHVLRKRHKKRDARAEQLFWLITQRWTCCILSCISTSKVEFCSLFLFPQVLQSVKSFSTVSSRKPGGYPCDSSPFYHRYFAQFLTLSFLGRVYITLLLRDDSFLWNRKICQIVHKINRKILCWCAERFFAENQL